MGDGYVLPPMAMSFSPIGRWLKRNPLEEQSNTNPSTTAQWESTTTFLAQLLQGVRGKLKNSRDANTNWLRSLRSLEKNLVQLISLISLMTKTDQPADLHVLADEHKSAMIGRMVNQPTYVINQLIRMEQMRNRRQKQLQESLQEW